MANDLRLIPAKTIALERLCKIYNPCNNIFGVEQTWFLTWSQSLFKNPPKRLPERFQGSIHRVPLLDSALFALGRWSLLDQICHRCVYVELIKEWNSIFHLSLHLQDSHSFFDPDNGIYINWFWIDIDNEVFFVLSWEHLIHFWKNGWWVTEGTPLPGPVLTSSTMS